MKPSRAIGLAIVLVLIVLAIVYLEGLRATPSGSAASAVSISLGANATTTLALGATETLAQVEAADKAAGDPPAEEIADPTGFINTAPFTLASLVGKKVILLDFWTYSCINCIRTLPYLTAWDAKYRDAGLEIIGIHTPEFDFEKILANVQAAVTKYGIKYPVVLDSNMGTWDAYGNEYWPSEYLIDIAGNIVENNIGEGGYANTEAEIQKLLVQRDAVLGLTTPIPGGTVDITAANLSGVNSPETYFGAARNEYLGNGEQSTAGTQILTAPSNPQPNTLYLNGTWDFAQQYASNTSANAEIIYNYDATNVYIVASGAAAGTQVEVLQDGAPISSAAGADVVNGIVTISGSRLYSIVSNPTAGPHTLELIVKSPGLDAYTFTFG